jgi:hypothetical protein
MCRIDDCERSTVSTNAWVKARKPHACVECGRTIQPSETYRRDTNLYEGNWDTYKTCQHCVVGQRWLASNCGGWVFEVVGEELVEHAKEYPAIGFGLLRVGVGMRRCWKRFDGAGLMAVPAMPRSIRSTLREAA